MDHVRPQLVAARIARNIVEHVGRAALPGLDAAPVVVEQERVDHLVVVDENAGQGAIVARRLLLAAPHLDARAVDPVEHIAGDFRGDGAADLDGVPLPVARGALADLVQAVAEHFDVQQPAGLALLGPDAALFQGDGAVVGVLDQVVADDHAVDDVVVAHGPEADGQVDVLERAVGHQQVASRPQQADAGHVDVFARQRRQVEPDVGEPHGEARDMDVAHAVDVDEVAAFGDLDVGGVGIGVAGEAEIQAGRHCPACRTRTRPSGRRRGTAACLPGSSARAGDNGSRRLRRPIAHRR